jgi:hypothetical protein
MITPVPLDPPQGRMCSQLELRKWFWEKRLVKIQSSHFYNNEDALMAVREWLQMRVSDLYYNEIP